MAWLKAAIYYFVTVFAVGVVLGPLRELVVKPRVGGLAAVLVEVPVMIAAMVFFAPRAARWAGLRGGWDVHVAMGMSALVLVLAAEALAAQTLRGWSLSQLVAHFTTPEGIVGLALYVVFAVVPLFSRAIAKERVP
jgi:hypothetical protein